MTTIQVMRRAVTSVAFMMLLVLGLFLPSEKEGSATSVQASSPVSTTAVMNVGFPVEDCATVVAATGAAALALVGGGYAGTVAGVSTLFFGTTAAAFHSAVGGVILTIKDPGHKCTRYIGNSASSAICNASNFSAWDPRGRAARSIVRLATANEYSRC